MAEIFYLKKPNINRTVSCCLRESAIVQTGSTLADSRVTKTGVQVSLSTEWVQIPALHKRGVKFTTITFTGSFATARNPLDVSFIYFPPTKKYLQLIESTRVEITPFE